jgi:drug/metabolite transporter (DMT)-like permease
LLGRKGFEGKGQVTGALTALQGLLSTPWLAVLLGLLLGVGLVAPLFWTSRLLTVENADIGTYVVMGVVLGGMIVSLGLMWGYRLITPGGFMWFGPAVIVGFVVTLGVLAVVMAMKLLKPGGEAAGDASKDETRR